MNRPRSTVDWLVGLVWLWCLAATACGKAKPKPPPPPVASAARVPCEEGETRDPPHQEARPGIQALRSNDFDGAARVFDALLDKYPESASLRVWLGDALLGQGSETATTAALSAYEQASALDARGCKLRDREAFFLAMGLVGVELRQKQPQQALAKLAEAAQKWPENAELSYERARAECALGSDDACFDDLKNALLLTRTHKRARFSRSHHASERLLERAAKDPELDTIRKQPRFRALLASATTSDAGAADDERAAP